MKTISALVATSRIPPSAGPRKKPTLSIVLETTFIAVSCSGVSVSDGRTAA
jgi:hypothetical protein